VARDRSEEVLYLYAVRPVTPWVYTLGKMFAVMLPAMLLLLAPSVLTAVLRNGILGDIVSTSDSLVLVAKAALASAVLGIGFAGVSVGPSAATRRGRWAMLLAIALFLMPEPFKFIYGFDAVSIGPASASRDLVNALFGDEPARLALTGSLVLLAYGTFGALLTRGQVQKEMRP
jgi:hypothetical protein